MKKIIVAIACLGSASLAFAGANADEYWKPLELDSERSVVISHINSASEKSGGIERLIEDSSKNNAEAKYQVAQMYLHGIYRFEKNISKGLDMMHDAASLNHPMANLMLGKAYLGQYPKIIKDGHIKLDKAKGIQMLERSAENDDPEAQYIVGISYIMGDAMPQDYDLGMFWLSRAENNGSIEAFNARQDLIFKKSQDSKSFEYTQDRVSGGNKNFLVELANFYLDDTSVVQNNREKAIRLLKTAARLQSEPAVARLNDLGIKYKVEEKPFEW